jgi:hypothetical protein
MAFFQAESRIRDLGALARERAETSSLLHKFLHRTDRDCTRIATLTTQLLERGSKCAYLLCDVCARACEELAEACDKHAEIEAFSRCGEAWRKCAEECAKLAKLKRAA